MHYHRPHIPIHRPHVPPPTIHHPPPRPHFPPPHHSSGGGPSGPGGAIAAIVGLAGFAVFFFGFWLPGFLRMSERHDQFNRDWEARQREHEQFRKDFDRDWNAQPVGWGGVDEEPARFPQDNPRIVIVPHAEDPAPKPEAEEGPPADRPGGPPSDRPGIDGPPARSGATGIGGHPNPGVGGASGHSGGTTTSPARKPQPIPHDIPDAPVPPRRPVVEPPPVRTPTPPPRPIPRPIVRPRGR